MADNIVMAFSGFCPICGRQSEFEARYGWLRDHLFCMSCKSIPRERALMEVIERYYPNFQDLIIHESSPGGRGVSLKLQKACRRYSYSHFFPDVPLGALHPKRHERCENLEELTLPDQSIDLFITQDVMEHVFDPNAAFAEIARVLRPGGAHIFTVPIVNKANPSERRADLRPDGSIHHFADAQYHGNPIDSEGSLVVMDWGYDILQAIQESSGLGSHLVMIDDLSRGIRAEYIDVIVSIKR